MSLQDRFWDKSVKTWTPTKRQEVFIRLPASVFEGFYGGAAGGGKSEIILLLPCLKGYHSHPRFKGIIFRRSYPELEESLIPRSHDYYPSLGAKYNAQNHVWTFPSGATIRFGYLDKDKDARKHDTAEYHYLGFDELTAFTEFMYRYMTSRVRSSIKELPAFVRSASNPGNIGHNWVRARFVEGDKEGHGKTIQVDRATGTKKVFVKSKLTDNPHLMENDPNYQNRLKILTEAERKAKLDGDWWTFSGQVFTEFRSDKIPDEPENALHVIEPFKIPSWWPKILSIDWGYAHKTWAGLCAISPDERVYLYKEHCVRKTKIKVWGADVARMCQFEENIVDIVMDPSAWRNDGLEKTIYQQFYDASGLDPRRADNDRIAGKLNYHDFLRWEPKPPKRIPEEGFNLERSHYILRMYGLKAQKEYEALFLPESPEENLPRLQVFKTCAELVSTIPLCVYDETKVEDVAKFDGDDPYDGSRYMLQAVDEHLAGLTEKEREMRKVSSVQEELQTSGDMTSYYRKMEKLESGNVKAFPVKRFHSKPKRRVGYGGTSA